MKNIFNEQIGKLLSQGLSTSEVLELLKLEAKRLRHRGVIIDYLRLTGLTKIKELYHIKRTRAQAILRKAGVLYKLENYERSIDVNKVKERFTCNRPFSSSFREIVDGLVLGDATIYQIESKSQCSLSEFPSDEKLENAIRVLKALQHAKHSEFPQDLTTSIRTFNASIATLMKPRTANIRYSQSILSAAWIYVLAQIFHDHGQSYSIHPHVDKNKRTGKIYPMIYIASFSTFQIMKEWFRWYSKGEKQIPLKLVLTPKAMLFWYIGDGGFDTDLKLHTQGYHKDEVDRLASLLSQTVNVHAKPSLHYSKKPGQYNISVLRSSAETFFAYLESDPELKNILLVAKQIYPWKFDHNIHKKQLYDYNEEYVDNNYFQTYLKVLKQLTGSNYLDLAKSIFPWKYRL